MTRRAVFLDLNGTLVLPVRDADPEDLVEIEGAREAVHSLNRAGFACPVVTVQSRIAKGCFSQSEFVSWFDRFRARWAEAGAIIEGPYVCPHREGDACTCRKPLPTLYWRAARERSLEPQGSFVVGDSAADVEAGRAIGARTCLVLTGSGEYSRRTAAMNADCVATDIGEAARWILGQIAA